MGLTVDLHNDVSQRVKGRAISLPMFPALRLVKQQLMRAMFTVE